MNGVKTFQKKLEQRLAGKTDDLLKLPGILGDDSGNLYFDAAKSSVYVRIGNQTSIASCPRIKPVLGLSVWVGYANEERTLYQILSGRTTDAQNVAQGGGYAPANYYRYLAPGGGQDPLWLEQRAWLPLRVGMTTTPSLSVAVYKGNVWTGSAFVFVASQNIDLTAQLPTTDGNAVLIMLTVDTDGDVIQTVGTETTLALLCPAGDEYSNAPAVPASTAEVIALVRVYYGQTAIREGRSLGDGTTAGFTDFIDVRGLYAVGGGGGGVVETVVAGTNVTVDSTDPANPIVSAAGWANEDIWENNASAGRLWGGIITDAGSGKIDIAAGAGVIKTGGTSIDGNTGIPTALNEGQGSDTSLVTWDAIADLDLAGVGYNLVFWDASEEGFAVALKADFYSVFNFVTDFTIGRVYYDGTTILSRLCGMNRWNFDRRVQMFGEERFPVERASGLMLSETGTRNIALTGGVLWAELVNRFSIDPFDSSDAGTFSAWYRDGSGGWTKSATQTAINNTQYDDGDGTLATLTANRYGVHWVFVVHDSSVHVVFGRGDYTLAQAELSSIPATLPGVLTAYGSFVGRIIVKKSAAAFTELASAFTQTIGASVVTAHNDLTGLQGGAADEYYHLTAAQATVVSNTSGTNTGDQTLSGLGGVPTSRTITTTAPLTIGGGASADLSADRTIAVSAATTSAAGVVELATSAEMTTATDTERAVTPDALRGSNYGKRVGTIPVIDAATTLTTGDGKKTFFIPAEFDGWKIVSLHASLVTPSTSGAPIVQIRNVTDSVDVLSTRITIDANQKTSYNATTAPVINTSNNTVATGDEIAIDIDGAGTGAKGLDVIVTLQKAGA